MLIPVQITYRNLEPSDAIETDVRTRASRLEKYFPRISSCRVMIEAPHRHHHKGRIYHVRVELGVPGGELVVRRDPAEHGAHEDVHVAIRDAFRGVRRELMDYARRMRGDVKTHAEPYADARVKSMHPEGYGFLETPDGRDIYFHENAVLGDFDHLHIGEPVRFVEESGDRGPQASTVIPRGGQAESAP